MITEQTNKIKIRDRTVEYTVEYRKVKYIRYELKYGKLRLVIPSRDKTDIEQIIHKKEGWIYRKLCAYDDESKKLNEKTRNMRLEQRTMQKLRQLVNSYMEEYEKLLNVRVNRVQFRDTVYKWGSCSINRNVTLSKNLRYLPDKLVAYIVYHELVHIIVLAHNDRFFEIMEREFPNYEEYDEKLKEYQFLIEREC
ncbi:MAG: hypothetical protein BZ135_07225 [Methanosphaera sp. rholeuAM6]|nr:MAG: hypothetical protein BZ135_07225 [Methanosphaera sp. rholeuAM6]